MSQEPLDLSTIRIDPVQSGKIPRTLAFRRILLALAEIDGVLHVASSAPLDEAVRSLLLRQTQTKDVCCHLADASAIRKALQRIYGPVDSVVTRGAPAEDAVAIMDEIFRAARTRHASDVHIDPGKNGITVRFRVDGVLEVYRKFPSELLAALVSRIKILSGMDIAEKRAAQDGAFSLPPFPDDPTTGVDVRSATLPVRHGERVTLRLLGADRQSLTLERLGMRAEHLQAVERVLESPHGLFLLTGPTGSGKTTTLYAAIRRLLAQGGLNILTVEDPIEYEMEGVAQAEIDSADKVSFTKALRSLLRHDPDVIMIGEIRDGESLDTAVKAALTGHLVLSTLHTNSAVGAVTRLSDMGLAPHLIAATLRMSIAQRLVRCLCPHCRTESVLSSLQSQMLQHPEAAGKSVYSASSSGCLYCAGHGYAGRTALFELFSPGEETASLIAKGVEEHELEAHLGTLDYQTLYDDALCKILDGTVSPQDVCREI